MRTLISVDPSKCRLWRLHERCAADINEHTCRGEIDSFARRGQLVPVLGRRLPQGSEHEFELIYGARRWFAANHLRMPLLMEVRELTDREGLVAMDIENRLRQDISPYERGLSYKRWLHDRQFESQEDLARALDVSASQISRLLQLARLPAVVVNAFRSPADIRENWGLDLIEALDDPQRRAVTIRAARSLADRTPPLRGREVMRKLLACVLEDRPKLGRHDKVVPGSDGSALFRIRYLNHSVALIIAADRISEQAVDRIEAALATILQGRRTVHGRRQSGRSRGIESLSMPDFGAGPTP
jgi:ParB family chromosome partitioning protein